jgi:Holliday junction resolvase RusA-like endonuclease
MKRDSVRIDYPGADACSVNHYLGRRAGGGYYVKPEAVAFKQELQWLLKHCHLEEYKLPLEVTCDGYFKDERSAPDLSNLSKVIMDSIQDLIFVNDKEYRWHDGKRVIGEKNPYLIITITETPTMATTMPSESIGKGITGRSGKIIHKRRTRGFNVGKNAIEKGK